MADIKKINGMNLKDEQARKLIDDLQLQIDSLEIGDISLAGYVTEDDLKAYALKTNIPTKVSDLDNDKSYATETYVNNKIAEASINQGDVNLSDYALKTDLHSHDNKVVLDVINTDKLNEWDNKVDKVDGKDLSSNDLTDSLKADYDIAYEHSQSYHFDGDYNNLINKPELENYDDTELRNLISTKADNNHTHTESVVTTNADGMLLNLTTDKLQFTTISNECAIILPTVSEYTLIHLFFTTYSTPPTITFPLCKWQSEVDIEANKTYEFIFTYVNNAIGWLGGCITYE